MSDAELRIWIQAIEGRLARIEENLARIAYYLFTQARRSAPNEAPSGPTRDDLQLVKEAMKEWHTNDDNPL